MVSGQIQSGAVDGVGDGSGGEQRDFVLAAAAAEENADAELGGHQDDSIRLQLKRRMRHELAQGAADMANSTRP